MPLLMAGVAAVSFGVADFLGGIAATRWRAQWVGATAQAVGLPFLLPLLVIFPGTGPTTEVVGWGVAAGVTAGIGITLLYRALAAGPMSVAAPTTAVVALIVPVVTGLLLGERPGGLALLGVVFGVLAVAIVGATAPDQAEPGAARSTPTRTAMISVGAGLGLGGAAIAFGQTSADSGLWPLAVARVVATALLLSASLRSGRPRGPDASSGLRLSLVTGIVDVIGSVFLVLALQRGLLTLGPVIASLYPVGTVLLARLTLDERVGRAQAAGLGLAGVAVVLIAGS
jgi:drug/metabolite transporter (DMT)-like permease